MHNWHGLKASPFQHSQARVEIKELPRVLVVNVELEKIVRQLAVMNRVLRVKPFAVEDELAAEHRFQHRALHRSPLLEQVVLRVHAFGDLVPATLQHHPTTWSEVN